MGGWSARRSPSGKRAFDWCARSMSYQHLTGRPSVHERGKKGLPLERVYRQLFNRNLYLKAYGKIYRNAGVLTPGVNEDTVDAMSLEKIDAIIEALRYERYHWKPARRIYIPKSLFEKVRKQPVDAASSGSWQWK